MFKAVEADFCATGAKAAAPATRDAKITAFIMVTVDWWMVGVGNMWSWCSNLLRLQNRCLRLRPIFLLQVW